MAKPSGLIIFGRRRSTPELIPINHAQTLGGSLFDAGQTDDKVNPWAGLGYIGEGLALRVKVRCQQLRFVIGQGRCMRRIISARQNRTDYIVTRFVSRTSSRSCSAAHLSTRPLWPTSGCPKGSITHWRPHHT